VLKRFLLMAVVVADLELAAMLAVRAAADFHLLD
jgi:hypothetical protein